MTLELSLLALSLLGGGHAALHPADASFYLETPDLAALCTAYVDAPLMQLLTDPEIEGFAARIAGEDPEEYRLDQVALGALESAAEEASPALAAAFRLLFEARAASFSLSFPPVDDDESASPQTSLLFAIEFSGAEAATGAVGALAEIVGEGRPAADGRPGWELAVPFGDGESLLWTRAMERTMFVGIGESGRAELDLRLEQPEHSLATDTDFLDGRAHLRIEEGVPVLESFLRLRNLSRNLRLVGIDLPPDRAAFLPAVIEFFFPGGDWDAHERTRLIGNRFVDESYSPDSAARPGLGGALGRKPVPPEALQLLPSNAVAAWVTTLEPEILRAEIERVLTLGTGRAIEELRAQWLEELDCDPLADLVGSLGTQLAVYSLPISGPTLPRIHVAIELTDPAAFERGLQGMGRFLTAISEGALVTKSRPYRNQPVYAFAPKQGLGELAGELGAPQGLASLAPSVIDPELAFGILEGRVILGLGDQGVKREIKRLLTSDEDAAHPLAAVGHGIPQEATSIGYIDWGGIFRALYDTLRAFAPLIAQTAEDLPFDLTQLPSSEVFTRHLKPTLSFSLRREHGTWSREESSFGPEIPAALALGVVMTSVRTVDQVGSVTEPDVEVRPVPPPAESQQPEPTPRAADPLELTRQRLLDVKLALVVYKTDQGRYPETLEALFEPTPRFPQGFLERDTPLEDGWGRALRYEAGAQGAGFELWSLGADGVDERGAGDDPSIR